MTASVMPATPAATPLRAVFGVLSQRNEKTKSAAAARYVACVRCSTRLIAASSHGTS